MNTVFGSGNASARSAQAQADSSLPTFSNDDITHERKNMRRASMEDTMGKDLTPAGPLPREDQGLSQGHVRSSRSRRWWRWFLWASAVYVFLGTFVWDVAFHLVLSAMFSLVHLGTPDDNMPPFIPYVHEKPAFRAICDFGNWVSDLGRPLISDEVMIAHWQKHHKEWEDAVAQAPGGNKTPEEYARFDKHLKSIGLEDINFDPAGHPGRFATIKPLKSIGRNHAPMRPCTGRGGSSKWYSYYPDQVPIIFGDKVSGASSLEFAEANKFEPMENRLVESTDRPYYTYVLRPLSERWFLERKD